MHPALRFPLFIFYTFYDNEAARKLVWTVRPAPASCSRATDAGRAAALTPLRRRTPLQFLMMMCFINSFTIPVPGLMPVRRGVDFSMNHLSALFAQDPGAQRAAQLDTHARGRRG